MILKVFYIQIIIILSILNVIIGKKNFMEDLFTIQFIMDLKLKSIIIKVKKKEFGNTLQQKVFNILVIHQVRNNWLNFHF